MPHHDTGEHGHEEAGERERFEPPAGAIVVRGVAMAGAAGILGLASLRLAKLGTAGIVFAGMMAAAAALMAWASAIHITGGERFDDHPWV
ncbi:MAG: hypothetical protein R3B97_08685 [Dehalococcoidia bacterium]|nr:hypothetical protein [Dehalococcoidia bacterium]